VIRASKRRPWSVWRHRSRAWGKQEGGAEIREMSYYQVTWRIHEGTPNENTSSSWRYMLTIMKPTHPTSEGTFSPLIDGVVALAVQQMFLTTGQPFYIGTFIYTRLPVELWTAPSSSNIKTDLIKSVVYVSSKFHLTIEFNNTHVNIAFTLKHQIPRCQWILALSETQGTSCTFWFQFRRWQERKVSLRSMNVYVSQQTWSLVNDSR
jgi:hypothetical protein